LRVLHWNIHSWAQPRSGRSNLDPVEELIRATAPDVVSLVEVDEPWDAPSPLAELAERCGYDWLFAPAFEHGDAAPRGGFGNALLSRLPIRAAIARQLTWPTTIYERTEPSEPRSVVLARIAAPGGANRWVGSTHLPRGDAAARTQAVQRLAGIVRTVREPWLVCGDFNTAAATWVEPTGFAVAPDPAQPTYPGTDPTECIDYAVADANSVLDADVVAESGPAPASDHLPILVRWTPRESRNTA
jgi:endonuclease/exonuclease/phosphatase family metal-dependent hydrolase